MRQEIPFPVESEHRVRPDLKRLDQDLTSTTLTTKDDLFDTYQAEKFRLLKRGQAKLLGSEPGTEVVLEAALYELAQLGGNGVTKLAHSTNDWAFEHSGFEYFTQPQTVQQQTKKNTTGAIDAWINSQAPHERLSYALGLSMQEDWALMQSDPKEGPRSFKAKVLQVCFPSGWAPEQKIGLPLESIHAPVADGQALRAASPYLAQAMQTKGPFARYVWTLSDSADLSRHPAVLSQPRPSIADQSGVFFRCERQTIVPLPEHNAALFLIRVYLAPIVQMISTDDRRRRMTEALCSMSDNSLTYKNLHHLKAATLPWLETLRFE
jgi:Protein of unknown function (DUF3445)